MTEATIVFWDVEHGHATYLQTPNGRHIVIDLGTGSHSSYYEFKPLEHLKSQYCVKQLDYVIITHPHVDHLDDVFNFDSMNPLILSRPKHLDKEPILEQASQKDKPKLEKYFEINERYNITVTDDSPHSLKNPNNWGGMKIDLFSPTLCGQSNLNNHSIVTTFTFEGLKVLIPGDNEPPSWNELKNLDSFADSTENVDILLAPHHGRISGFDNDTMRHFNPRLTIVSDGSYCDTSATSRYSAISRGWTVYKKDGSSEMRYCLTTRKDGVIKVKIRKGAQNNSFLNVTLGN